MRTGRHRNGEPASRNGVRKLLAVPPRAEGRASGGTLGYRSLRLLCASLTAFHLRIRTSVNAGALAHVLGAGRSSKTYSPSTTPENRKRAFRRLPARPERPLGSVGVQIWSSFQYGTPPARRIASAASGSRACPERALRRQASSAGHFIKTKRRTALASRPFRFFIRAKR